MANRENSRGRLLCLMNILQKDTDEQHGLTIKELISKLEEAGFSADRKTLYVDIEALQNFDVPVESSGGNVPKYFIEDRTFEVEEIMILIDAVESAGFMTEKKKANLIAKLKGLTSSPRALELNEQIHYIGRHHSVNKDYIYNVGSIRRAMAEHHPVTFQYLDYHYGKGQILKHDGFRYILHPFALVWNNGFYYCIGTCPEQKSQEPDKIIHFRIDRMKGVSIKEDTVLVKPPKGFSVAKHMESSFSMYGNRSETVQIRFKKELLTQFFDRFEQTVHVFEDTDHEGYLLANVEVSVSPTFFSWVSQYGGGFTIAGPDRVRRLYHEHLEEALKA